MILSIMILSKKSSGESAKEIRQNHGRQNYLRGLYECSV